MEVARSCGNREERDMFCVNCGVRLEDEYRMLALTQPVLGSSLSAWVVRNKTV